MKKKLFIVLISLITIGTLAQIGFSDSPFDKDAEIDYSLTNTNLFGYRIIIIQGYPFVYFRDKDNPVDNLAQYNWKEQYWLYKSKGFNDSEIKLEKLFKKIDLSKTQLYRDMPAIDNTVNKLESENKAYDYSSDKDFADFITYLKKHKTPQERLDFYLKAGNNPAKRGKKVPFEYGKNYSASEVGIQLEHFKPIALKNVFDGNEMRNHPMITAGGMQLYFELKKQEYVRAANKAYSIFRDTPVVPLVIVELEPEEEMTGPKILRGKALVSRVKADLEKFTKKKFKISLKTMKISYTDFANHGSWTPLSHYDNFFDKTVHPYIDKNSMVIYYFTDRNRLKAIDKDMSHPLTRGPYATDWANVYRTIIHEMGHSLGMRHHFNDEQTGSADINTHISPSCVMNYKFRKDEFCELCLYSLGIK